MGDRIWFSSHFLITRKKSYLDRKYRGQTTFFNIKRGLSLFYCFIAVQGMVEYKPTEENMMKKVLISILFLGITTSAWAADPIIGTWKLNAAESKSPPDFPLPAAEMTVYREVDENLIELSDGLPGSEKWTWPRQGGIASMPASVPRERMYVETLIEPGNWYVTIMENGVQVATYHKVVSTDGKKLRQTLKLISPEGKHLERIDVMDKQ